MKSFLRLVSLFLIIGVGVAHANPRLTPPPPKIAATGYILEDFSSGYVLAEHNADERLEPASLTKLMTAYAVFEELGVGTIQLTDTVRISTKAWRTPGSRMFVEVGSDVPVQELLYGMIIQSGNDASVALAEHIAGSEEAFALLMNSHARALGMGGTQFANSTGLPNAQHYSTARDMARLARAMIQEYPEYYSWYAIKNYTYNNITQYNRNSLLWRDKSVDGMKTGHTEAAGYCLVASANRGNMRLISVMMGTNSENARAEESQKLLDYGYRFFETHRLYASDEALKTMRVWKGASETLELGLGEELHVTVPRGQYGKLTASMTIDRPVEAPVAKGERLGTVSLRIGEDEILNRPLVALADVKKGGLWRQITDNVLLMFE